MCFSHRLAVRSVQKAPQATFLSSAVHCTGEKSILVFFQLLISNIISDLFLSQTSPIEIDP